METSPHRKTWIVALLALAFALAYLFVLYLPGRRQVSELSDDLRSKQEYLATTDTLAAMLEATRGRLDATRQYNDTWAASVPSDVDVAAILGRVNALAVASGCTPTRFDPEPVVAMDKLRRVPVALGCTGEFTQISQFLYDIETLPRFVWIDRLHIESTGEAGGLIECELDLIIFAGNPDNSDQVDLAGQPIKEETDRRVPVRRPPSTS